MELIAVRREEPQGWNTKATESTTNSHLETIMEITTILAKELYGNTVGDLLISLALVLAAALLAKYVYRLLALLLRGRGSRFGLKVVPRLHTLLEGPIVFGLIVFSIFQALSRLQLPTVFQRSLSIAYFILMVLAATWLVTRIFDAIIEEYVAPAVERSKLQMEYTLPVIRRVIHVGIWAIAITIVLDNVGLDILAILTGVGIGGIALALAAQHTLGNVIAGFNILSDRHVSIGDRIQIKGEQIDGTLLHVGLRTTRIRSRYEGRIISIPNSIVAQQAVVNVDSEQGRQIFAVYKLAPDTSHKKLQLAMDLLKTVAEQNEETKDLVITGLLQVSDISRDVMLLYWIDPEASNLETRTAVNLEIIKCFEEHGIQLTEKGRYEYQKKVYL
jgi:MscS family membrane protein